MDKPDGDGNSTRVDKQPPLSPAAFAPTEATEPGEGLPTIEAAAPGGGPLSSEGAEPGEGLPTTDSPPPSYHTLELDEEEKPLAPARDVEEKRPFGKGTERVPERYEIDCLLGEGGMGQVYRAYDLLLDRWVAIKLLSSFKEQSLASRRRFLTEARAAARLSHPNIAMVYDVSDLGGYIVMEYLPGHNLNTILAHEGPLKLERVLQIARQLLNALAAAHRAGIIHRDVKPANVIVDAEGCIKLTDFGIARLPESKITLAGHVMGTPMYMSPEQLRALPDIDSRTDLFSLGATLYELLSGAPPEVKGNRPLSEVAPEAAAMDPLIQRCLKNREERWSTAEEMLEVVTALQEGREYPGCGTMDEAEAPGEERPAAEAPSTLQGPVMRWKRALVSAIVLALLVGAIIALAIKKSGSPSMAGAARGGVPTVAVINFENLSPQAKDLNWLGKGLASMVTTELSRTPGIKVIGYTRLLDVMRGLGGDPQRRITSQLAIQVARKARANYLVLGDLVKLGRQIRVQARIVDLSSGLTLKGERVDGRSPRDAFLLADKLARGIAATLTPKSRGSAETAGSAMTTRDLLAYRHYQTGLEHLSHAQFKRAKKAFSKAVEMDPNFARAYFRLGLIQGYFGRAHSSRALDALSRSLKKREKLSRKEIAVVRGTMAYIKGDFQRGVAIFKRLKQDWPVDKDVHYGLGISLMNGGYAKEAANALAMVIELDPNYLIVYEKLIKLLLYTGQLNRAESFVRQYKALVPDSMEAESFRITIMISRRQFDRALLACRQAIKRWPDQYRMRRMLGDIFVLGGEYEKAVAAYRSLSRHPTISRWWRAIALVYAAFTRVYSGQYRAAMAVFGKAQEICGSEIDVCPFMYMYWDMGIVSLLMGQRPEAEKHLGKFASHLKSAKNEKHRPLFFLLKGLILARDGQGGALARLLGQLKKGPALRRQRAVKAYLEGRLKMLKGRTRQAVKLYQEAINRVMARYYLPLYKLALARGYMALGRYKKAESVCSDVIHPIAYSFLRSIAYPHCLYIMGTVRQKRRDDQGARRYYGKLVKLWEKADAPSGEVKAARAYLAK